jgi:ATP-dependent Clp protease protease subunit
MIVNILVKFLLLSFYCFIIIFSQQIITLKKNNFININKEINSENINIWSKELSKINSNPTYIYIDSPGGSVDAGLQFINTINWYLQQDKNVSCIAKSAYSMAFIIFQHCSNRYIMLSTSLMQHQMSLSGLKGPINNMMNYLEMVNTISYELDNKISSRLNMTLTDYRTKISNDWWVFGSDIIKNNMADELVIVGCDSELFDITTNQDDIIVDINSSGELELKKITKSVHSCPL